MTIASRNVMVTDCFGCINIRNTKEAVLGHNTSPGLSTGSEVFLIFTAQLE